MFWAGPQDAAEFNIWWDFYVQIIDLYVTICHDSLQSFRHAGGQN